MKAKIFVLLFYVSLSVNAQWTKQVDLGSEHFYTLSFLNKDIGWVYDNSLSYKFQSKTTYKTTNGGTTWNSVSTPKTLNNIVFIDENNGYADAIYIFPPGAYYTTRIMKTTNGGITWDIVDERLTAELRSIFFISKDIGWVCYEYLVKTTDGGNTWIKQFAGDGDMQKVYFKDERNGWLLTNAGHYYTTNDGGSSWTFHNSPLIFTMDFISNEIGFCSQPNGTYKTTDGGKNWNQIFKYGSRSKIKFFNSNIGFVHDAYNVLRKTVDGGKTWVDIPIPATGINGFEAVAPNQLWIINDSGVYKKDTSTVLNLTAPTGTDTLYSGFQYNIQWLQNNLEGYYVKLEFSTNNGISWSVIKDSVKVEDQKYLWKIPTLPNFNNCLIRISEFPNGYKDVSESPIPILNETRKIFITEPTGSKIFRTESLMYVKWDANYTSDSNVQFEFIPAGYANPEVMPLGSKFASIKTPYSPKYYRLKLTDTRNPQIYTVSDSFLVKAKPYLEISYPGGPVYISNRNNIFPQNSSQEISFTATNIQLVNLKYSTNSGTDWLEIENNILADSNTTSTIKYNWKIPNTPSKNCIVLATSSNEPNVFAKSNLFEISDNEIIAKFPLSVGNKWFYNYWYSYNETNQLKGIQAIWVDADTVKLEDNLTYHLVKVQKRVDQNNFIFSTYDTCFIRQDKNNLIVRDRGSQNNFIPSMNFCMSFCNYEWADTSNILKTLLKRYRIGGSYSAHFITDNLGFTNYNWREQRHGYGGFAAALAGCILNGKAYGETLSNNTVGINNPREILPTSFSISQNFPNPFNPSTTINYTIASAGNVTLKVYDLLGREVETLVDEFKQPGNYNVKFSVETLHGASLPTGVYFYRLQCGSFSQTKKLLLIK